MSVFGKLPLPNKTKMNESDPDMTSYISALMRTINLPKMRDTVYVACRADRSGVERH